MGKGLDSEHCLQTLNMVKVYSNTFQISGLQEQSLVQDYVYNTGTWK